MAKSALLISIVALTVACNGSRHQGTDSSATSTGASSQARGGTASGNTSPGASGDRVTLVGCLQTPGARDTVGTGGSASTTANRSPSGVVDHPATEKHGAAATAPLILANATLESGGADANAAGGGPGGPAASAGTSFELDGAPADAHASVNKRVRVTGRIDQRPAADSDARGATSPSTAGGTSSRDDVRANSTAVAGDATNRRLTVETLQVVAQQCGQQ
jgi:hypothetical protein